MKAEGEKNIYLLYKPLYGTRSMLGIILMAFK